MAGKALSIKEVPIEKLRWICNPDSLGFNTSQDCEKSDGIVGQERARKAIVMGLEISSPGYNIYASGVEGTGKLTTIKNLLNQIDLKKKGSRRYLLREQFQGHGHAARHHASRRCGKEISNRNG